MKVRGDSVKKKLSDRVYYIDILRVLACIAVIMIHASDDYLLDNFGSSNFMIGNVIDSISRIGVPIFVMISGALLLNKNHICTKEKQFQRIKRMLLFFFFWSCIYTLLFNVMLPLKQGNAVSLSKVISELIIGHYHLWYIYLLIGLYLILPLLRLWIDIKNMNFIKYYMFLAVLFSFLIPQIINIGLYFSNEFALFNNILNLINISYVGGYTLYFILGWFLYNNDIKHECLIYFLGIVSILYEVVMTHFLSVYFNRPIQMYDNLSINVLLQSVMVFIFIKSKYQNYNGKQLNLIRVISKYSLGIYAIHVAILDVIQLYSDSLKNYNAFIVIILMVLISLIGSLLISILMSKVKLLRKYVH